MAIQKIITAENPVLRQKGKKVHRFDSSIQKLIDDMFETMHEAHGAGLAAPQIALSLRVFVAEYEDRKVAMVNPEIIKAEGEEIGTEACLSIPGYAGDNIRRSASVIPTWPAGWMMAAASNCRRMYRRPCVSRQSSRASRPSTA